MPHIRHLKNAPISEALLDIRVKARVGFGPADFGDLPAPLNAEYPKREEVKAMTMAFRVPASTPPEVKDLGLHGIFFRSDDKNFLTQFRTDGFTLNRLKPYTDWEDFFTRAQRLWEVYVEKAQPEFVTRLALRYINHVQLPSVIDDLRTYMQVPPLIPEGLPQAVNAFFWKVTIEDPDRGLSAHITQSLEPKDDNVTFLIDIDAFRSVDCGPRDPLVYETLSTLRGFKNQIFFSFLTEEAIGRFE